MLARTRAQTAPPPAARGPLDQVATGFTRAASCKANREDVLEGYRLLLGREPENDTVITEACNGSVRNFMLGFFQSREFATAVMETLVAGLPLRHARGSTGPTPSQIDWLLTHLAGEGGLRRQLGDKRAAALPWDRFFFALLAEPAFAGVVPVPARVPATPALDLLAPGPIERIRVDLTTNCNLRCVYCAVSQATYAGSDMTPDLVERAKDFLSRLARYHRLAPIDINGHGETTMLPHWVEFCRYMVRSGIPMRLTSNFSKEFDDAELDMLARMRSIAISLDASDRDLTRRIRRRVDVRQIVMNVHRVRMAAQRAFIPPPKMRLLSGLYDQNSLQVEELARLAISLGADNVEFWSLTEYPYVNTDVAAADQVRALDTLPNEALLPRVLAVRRAMALLRDAGVSVSAQGDFVGRLARRVGLDG